MKQSMSENKISKASVRFRTTSNNLAMKVMRVSEKEVHRCGEEKCEDNWLAITNMIKALNIHQYQKLEM